MTDAKISRGRWPGCGLWRWPADRRSVCGQLLGDMGAEVIKLEPPGVGDPMRAWGRGAPVWWKSSPANKRSVSLNLRTPEGQQIARDLIAKADILIENFRPGTLEKWNLDPAKLREANPGLIVVRVSGYGQSGPIPTAPASAASARPWAAGAISSASRTAPPRGRRLDRRHARGDLRLPGRAGGAEPSRQDRPGPGGRLLAL